MIFCSVAQKDRGSTSSPGRGRGAVFAAQTGERPADWPPMAFRMAIYRTMKKVSTIFGYESCFNFLL